MVTKVEIVQAASYCSVVGILLFRSLPIKSMQMYKAELDGRSSQRKYFHFVVSRSSCSCWRRALQPPSYGSTGMLI